MDDKKQEMMAMLNKLADSFHSQIPARVEAIACGWKELNDEFTLEKQADLLRISHSLAGTSATFGFTNISKVAKELELSLQDIDSIASLNKHATTINEHIERLKQIEPSR